MKAADAIVVGSGPNGLAAAIEMARAGHSVTVYEAEDTIGGGTRSAELTLPGFVHDRCSAFHPLGLASPFFRSAELDIDWVHPDVPLAHPLDDGSAVILDRSVERTAAGLGVDGKGWHNLFDPLVRHADELLHEVFGPLRPPRHPLVLARFGIHAVRPASRLGRALFDGERARALFAGCAAHSFLSLDAPISAAAGMVLALLGHAVGWPLPRGGSQRIADALAERLRSLGGEIHTGHRVRSIDELPPSAAVLLDLTPRQVMDVAGHKLPASYARRLSRYRYGPGVFKLDWALDGPIPWKASECLGAGTVHLGGTMDEVRASEGAVSKGEHAERPYMLVGQQSLFDTTRAPDGRQTVWAYCHVPNGSTVDMTRRMEDQIERFAPGFRDRVMARNAMLPADLERTNANLVGGDINGGLQDFRQLFTRPVARLVPYSTPIPRLFLCSSSTPPGGGVHGMCGYFAARAAVRALRRKNT